MSFFFNSCCFVDARSSGFYEKLHLTPFQNRILVENPELARKIINRWSIKEETGKWILPDQLKKIVISEGGEALIIGASFGDLKTAVRIQAFDPLLFTDELSMSSLSYKINLCSGRSINLYQSYMKFKDFENVMLSQYPAHENVVRHYANIELFHKDDICGRDCIGWITIMEKCDTNLRQILKEGKLSKNGRRELAYGIGQGMDYLFNNGMHNADLKMENILIKGKPGCPKICDFGLVEDRTSRIGNRAMGYARKGSKFKLLPALCKCLFFAFSENI